MQGLWDFIASQSSTGDNFEDAGRTGDTSNKSDGDRSYTYEKKIITREDVSELSKDFDVVILAAGAGINRFSICLCMYICICMNVCIVCMYICIVCIYELCVCMYVCIVCMYMKIITREDVSEFSRDFNVVILAAGAGIYIYIYIYIEYDKMFLL
jgi:hypothetical protein